MISEISPAQSSDSTSNPQQVSSDSGASDSASFQQSAGQEALSQNHSLTVEQTGQPIDSKPTSSSSAAFLWLLVVIVTVALIAGAAIIYKWILKRPAIIKDATNNLADVQQPKKTVDKIIKKPATKKTTKKTAKPKVKKQSRSKRKK